MIRDFFRHLHINAVTLREEYRSEHGQTMAEYGVVLSVITIAAVAAFLTLGGNIGKAINYVATQIKSG
jgi:Flp pilus assembly pilin Flp